MLPHLFELHLYSNCTVYTIKQCTKRTKMFHISCDSFKTIGTRDAVSDDSELVWIGGCEAMHGLKIVIANPTQLNRATELVN